jgi:predicted metal-dependent phosphoesterase TrpH
VSRVDLHIHSNASDGKLSPEAIVKMAAELGLKYIALTDHDSVAGIPAALKAGSAFPELTFIPGVEISTEVPEGEVHILGYFVDFADKEFLQALERFRNSRQGRAQGMIAKLGKMGIDIDWARVQAIAGDGVIGRPHIARAMLEKGYITTFEEAFEKYIGHGGPAYVERDKMTPAEAVELVRRARGLPVLAHPFTVTEPETLVKKLKITGLVGLEAYYKDASREDVKTMLRLAEKNGLIATGGSDYHGIGNSTEVSLGGVDVPLKVAEKLIALAGNPSRSPFMKGRGENKDGN